jgi:FMN phosphatase YigB (HAD superfamily)
VSPSVAFLFDVDNTLLNNDRVKVELAAGIAAAVGSDAGDRFWAIYDEVRRERDFVDYPLTLQRFRDEHEREPGVEAVTELVLGFPYETVLYPDALQVLAHVQSVGPAAIVTDGDPVYQPAKIERAGITRAVEGRVFVYTHKEHHLLDVQAVVQADRYVLVDDKRSILADVEDMHGHVVTVHVRQGHYADLPADGLAPNVTINRIGDLLALDPAALWSAKRGAAGGPCRWGRRSR